jgi:hypothetical protein
LHSRIPVSQMPTPSGPSLRSHPLTGVQPSKSWLLRESAPTDPSKRHLRKPCPCFVTPL